MPHLPRVVVATLLTLTGGWLPGLKGWGPNVTNLPQVNHSEPNFWSQARHWLEEKVDEGYAWAEATGSSWSSSKDARDKSESAFAWDAWLGVAADAFVSFLGWIIFGSAWQGVKSGCQRALRLVLLLVVCLMAHYMWAICWPVISLCSAVLMGIIWIVRAIVKKLGTLVYWAQRAAGGVPEATGAEFLGPGTGRIPETADLRTFKKSGSADKWVLVRREGKTAVFKVGADSQTIRTPGLFVSVEADSMRGDPDIVEACKGHDKLHLCRNLNCAEEGQHFKEYALARDFDAERFQLKNAELEAAKAGRTLWAWFWSAASDVKKVGRLEFGSESEPEEAVCEAHKIRWSEEERDACLCKGLCKGKGNIRLDLLQEDCFGQSGQANLCSVHAFDYERTRRTQACSHVGCNRVAVEESKGVRLCRFHGDAATSTPTRRRSPRTTRVAAPMVTSAGDDPEEPELPASAQGGKVDLRDLRKLLAEVKGESPMPSGRKSPGNTPKSSIQRNLALLGLQDSPPRDFDTPLLEEFFNQYAEGRQLGLAEEEVRMNLATERGLSLPSVTSMLVQQAVVEQDKGQKGLSKFIKVWQRGAPDSGSAQPSEGSSKGSPAKSWEVVSSPPEPQATSRRGTNFSGEIKIAAPAIYDRKAGATHPADETPGSMEDIARAIKSQTAEIASLVKSHTETAAAPSGTLKGLNRQSEELVFLLRACNQYTVTVGAGEQGQALANALLSAQIGASTKLRRAGFKQKVTNRLAVGIAGPYWGSQEKYALAASDFVPYTDAELDAFTHEARSNKGGPDQRPAPATKFEDWEGRARRQNDVWALVYGEEWRQVRTHALDLLKEWHQSTPHKWPLVVLSEVWEELHWRFMEELKETLRLLKKEAGRETMSLQDIKFFALLPDEHGRAWLELPRTFDLLNPEGWFTPKWFPESNDGKNECFGG